VYPDLMLVDCMVITQHTKLINLGKENSTYEAYCRSNLLFGANWGYKHMLLSDGSDNINYCHTFS